MKKENALREIKEEEFLALSKGSLNKNFVQSLEMYNRYKERKTEVYLIGLVENQKLVAGGVLTAPFSKFGKKVFKMPYGWLGEYSEKIIAKMTVGLKEFVKKKGGMAVMVNPYLEVEGNELSEMMMKNSFKYLGEYEFVKWIYVLELKNRTKEEIFAGFRGNWRRNIKNAVKAGAKVREIGVDELGDFLEVLNQAGKRHDFSGPLKNYYKEMKEFFGDKVKFMVAEKEIDGKNKILAAGMFVKYGKEVIYLYSGSDEEYRKMGAQYAIQWEMIQEAISEGYERYNFYGVKPIDGEGGYEFKKGFRGRVVELAGSFMLPIGWMGRIYVATKKQQKYGNCC